ncbi:MAG TPA: metalloregulator ArsR/SmtB family transcription factor [Thermaerobacter sp.]
MTADRPDTDKQLLELQARLCHVLASPKRLEILYTLADGEMTAGELARAVDTTTANLSQHLALMRQFGLVESRKEGLNVYYRLASREILEACRAVRAVLLEHLRRSALLAAGNRGGPEPDSPL